MLKTKSDGAQDLPLQLSLGNKTIYLEDPGVTLEAAGKNINFLFYTGAACSVLTHYEEVLSSRDCMVTGINGQAHRCCFSIL